MAEDDPTTVAPKRPRSRRAVTAPAASPAAAEVPADMPPPEVALATVAATAPVVAEDGTSLEADRLEMRLSAVGRVETAQLTVNQGAVGVARAERVSVDRGAVGAALADHVEVSRGFARSVLARQVRIEQSGAQVVIAADVSVNQAGVMFLIARRVSGDVRVLLDWRGALAFGAAAGLVFGFIASLRRRAN